MIYTGKKSGFDAITNINNDIILLMFTFIIIYITK